MVQEISALQIITGIGVLVAIISQVYSISNMNKKNRDKYATKEFVKQENKAMDTKISSIEKDVAEEKRQNEREHDKMQDTFNKIDEKLDKIFDLIRKAG